MVSAQEILPLLKNINWSFPKYSSNGHITSLHPYPARFIPVIPRTLIDISSSNKSLNILDPFAGCGTTLVEGLNAGHNVFGIDVNNLAILLQTVYTHPYSDKELSAFDRLTKQIESRLSSNSNLHINITVDNIPNLDHWFTDASKERLYLALLMIEKSGYPKSIKNLAKFAISRIVVKISNQQSDTQYRAINKNLSKRDISRIILSSLKYVRAKYYQTNKGNKKLKNKALVILGDAREKQSYQQVGNIDLVITSPPYPNAYEYWLYHKYRMFWLKMDPLWARQKEIGARPYYSGSGKLGAVDFKNDMEMVLDNLYQVTRPQAIQFWLVGDSILKGRVVKNDLIISDACNSTGWEVVDILGRRLQRKRSSFQGIGRQKKEKILVIKKIHK